MAAVLMVALAGLAAAVDASITAPLTSTALAGASGPLLNGDFEEGNLSWWTRFQTTNGRVEATASRFDTNNDGVASYSAEFGVGQNAFEGIGVQRGGGMFQNVILGQGDLAIAADIASNLPYSHCNGDGGTIQLLVDGVTADQHSFGDVCGGSPKYGKLSASLSLNSSDTHEIRFLITRGALGPAGVLDYVDDVMLSGSAAVKPLVGSPTMTPAKPRAGKRLSISFPVTRSDTGAALTAGTMKCDPSVKGKIIGHAESFANGIARVSFVIPKTAKGKLLTVRVTITAENGLSTATAASFRVR